ncbi:hypothetical protein FEE59_24990 [Herbaspirillum sp. RU 5E]|nr:hypothetical protein [Herbaspirillum sp. RU 5E]
MHFRFVCLLIAFAAVFLETSDAFAQMRSADAFNVNESGAATYSIPIRVPSGIAGMEPKLSLTFNSQSGNGILGQGWSLGGLGIIARCARTVVQDGVRGGINYDQNDRFCLDGQRLIAVTGPDGADGTEYRTERESFAKVVSYGAVGSGPAWFKVWTKSGLVMYYGATSDSRIEVQGKASIRQWALNRIEDTAKNYMTVSYSKDATNGEYYPSRVDYSGNDKVGLSTPYSVRFFYESLPQIVPMYNRGSRQTLVSRISSVQIYGGDKELHRYQVQYQAGGPAKTSVVSSVQECVESGARCFPAQQMINQWGAGDLASWAVWSDQTGVGGIELSLCALRTLADVDGDGLPDMICVYNYGGGSTRTFVRLAQGSAIGPWMAWSGQTELNGLILERCRLLTMADVDGDGLADVVCAYDYGNGVTSTFVQLSNGTSLTPWRRWSEPTGSGGFDLNACKAVTVADVNADGQADLICVYDYGRGVTSTFVQLSLGTGFAGWTRWSPQSSVGGFEPSHCTMLTMADVNGDGLADVVCAYDYTSGAGVTGTFVQLNTGGGFTGWSLWVALTGYGGFDLARCRLLTMADVNGDGLPDVVCAYDYSNGAGVTGTFVQLNTGSGFIGWSLWAGLTAAGGFDLGRCKLLTVGDLNGDGLADLICAYDYGNGVTATFVQTSQGTQYGSWLLRSPQTGVGGFDLSRCVFLGAADINGDGMSDLVCGYDYGRGVASFFVQPFSGSRFLSVAGITRPGFVTSITYRSAVDASVYTKATRSGLRTYPLLDIKAPIYLVSNVSMSNGLDGVLNTAYTYGELKVDLSGRGALGFRWVQERQIETGLVSYTEYRQDWPYVGLPSLVKKTVANGGNGGVLSQTTTSYGCNDPSVSSTTACTIAPGKRYFVYAKQSLESSWDYNGAALPVVTRSSEYDNWGNATKVDVTTDDGFKKSTVNTYANDSVNWYLGRLLKSSVTSSSP